MTPGAWSSLGLMHAHLEDHASLHLLLAVQTVAAPVSCICSTDFCMGSASLLLYLGTRYPLCSTRPPRAARPEPLLLPHSAPSSG